MLYTLATLTAKPPVRSTEGSGGYDICADQYAQIKPNQQAKIDTGLRVAIPQGFVGIIKARSSWALKYSIDVHAGVIDSDYRGLIAVCLINHGDRMIEIKSGDRIAQLVIVPHYQEQATAVPVLPETGRGTGGFGSTGGI